MITKQDLLKYVTDIEIFQKYIDEEIIPGRLIYSPLRNERNPSFGFFKGQSGEICFKDFVLGSGDCIKFVQMKFNMTYFEALSKIAIDFDMENDFIVKQIIKSPTNSIKSLNRDEFLANATTFELLKKSRKWLSHDILFWQQYGISISTLEKFNVQPISHFFINKKVINADKHAYVFIEFKDGTETYKIYQPYNTLYKWLNSHNNTIWQGWSQLPAKGTSLIITKSLKDVMAIYENTKIPAVALQCENVLPKRHVFEQLNERFIDIYAFYDNDFDKEINWGKQFGNKLATEFGLIEIYIDDKYKSKDFSDLIKNTSITEATKILTWDMMLPF
jgi:flagellar biosynthesis regulator FlbT